MPNLKEYHLGDCDNCSTEQVLVYTYKGEPAAGRLARRFEDETLCQVCESLVMKRENESVNLAICTNMILKELQIIKNYLVGR